MGGPLNVLVRNFEKEGVVLGEGDTIVGAAKMTSVDGERPGFLSGGQIEVEGCHGTIGVPQ